jgi:hypothetical protein
MVGSYPDYSQDPTSSGANSGNAPYFSLQVIQKHTMLILEPLNKT